MRDESRRISADDFSRFAADVDNGVRRGVFLSRRRFLTRAIQTKRTMAAKHFQRQAPPPVEIQRENLDG